MIRALAALPSCLRRTIYKTGGPTPFACQHDACRDERLRVPNAPSDDVLKMQLQALEHSVAAAKNGNARTLRANAIIEMNCVTRQCDGAGNNGFGHALADSIS